jgi:hypothetical protein
LQQKAVNHIVIQSAFSDQERRINLTTIVYKDGYLSGDGRVTLGDTIISDDTVKVFKVNNCLIVFWALKLINAEEK